MMLVFLIALRKMTSKCRGDLKLSLTSLALKEWSTCINACIEFDIFPVFAINRKANKLGQVCLLRACGKKKERSRNLYLFIFSNHPQHLIVFSVEAQCIFGSILFFGALRRKMLAWDLIALR